METKRSREALAKMTPEQRAAVEAIKAKHKTPEYRAEVRKEFPPIEADEAIAGLAASFKVERERSGLSLSDLQEKTGIDRATLSKIENGKVPNPTYSTLAAFAHALGCRVTVDLERAE
ncbi:helix-turn-helix transcriptional regulator [Singulisphaera sp. Ch08]|uniref:Helix-turn-helix transcriptional regulator n=1 Tax=Singulisphaera sp. Ch08 TaxID=3120278 RepID=A0AAU7CKU4_9BACT